MAIVVGKVAKFKGLSDKVKMSREVKISITKAIELKPNDSVSNVAQKKTRKKIFFFQVEKKCSSASQVVLGKRLAEKAAAYPESRSNSQRTRVSLKSAHPLVDAVRKR